MLDRDEQLGRIIAAWTERGVNDDTTVTEMADIAVTALECGEPHPDRRDIRCSQLPHGNGHLFHRNSGLGIEWWASGDRTTTIHDVLGSIYLGQPLATVDQQDATRPVPCPECRWIRQDGRDHSQLTGGWTRCAHCGHEWNGPKTRPSTWCRAKHPQFDAYCDTLHHPWNIRRHGSSTYGVQWVDPEEPAETDKRGRYHTLPPCEDDVPDPEPAAPAPGSRCGVKHPRWEWRCHRDPHDVNPDDHSTWHHDYDRDRYWGHTQEPAAPATEEADHGPWGVGDTIPDHVDHVENAHKFEWSRVRNRGGENAGWFELTACPVLTEADLLVLCGPVTESTDPPELADALSATIDADRAVYRDLVPVLGPVATFLDQMGKRYREGNPRTTADQCRAAETFRDQLTTVVDTLLGMTGPGTDDKA